VYTAADVQSLSQERFVRLRGECESSLGYRLRVALACGCACIVNANIAADECVIDRKDAGVAAYPIRLFGGIVRVPVDYTLYGDSALARRGARPPVLEFHDLTKSGALASISIGNVADAGETLTRDRVLCTLGTLTVRQAVRSSTIVTIIHDNQHYLTLLSSDANAWKVLLQEFGNKQPERIL